MFKHLCSDVSVAVIPAPQEPPQSYSCQIFIFQEPPFTSKQTQCLSYKFLHSNDSVTNMVYLLNHKENTEEISQNPKIHSEMFPH